MQSREMLNSAELKGRLAQFFEIYLSTKILEATDGALQMFTLACKLNRSKKPVEKLINYKLLRVKERLLDGKAAMSYKDLVVCQFLIEELHRYVATSEQAAIPLRRGGITGTRRRRLRNNAAVSAGGSSG